MLTTFRRRLLLRSVMVADLLVFIGALLAATWVNSLLAESGKFALSKILYLELQVLHVILLLTLMGVWHVSFRMNRLYQSRRFERDSQEVKDIFKAVTGGTAVFLVLGRLFTITIVTPVFLAMFWTTSMGLTVLYRFILHEFLIVIRRRGKNIRFVVILGTNQRAYRLARLIEEKRDLGYRIVGYVDDRIHEENGHVNYLGTLEHLPKILRSSVVDEIIITLPVKSYYAEIERIVELAGEQGIRVRYPADIFSPGADAARKGSLEEFAVMTAITGRQREWYLLQKRATDLLLASVLLIAVAPLLLAIALAIKVSSPGPVLFIQPRVGLNKRRFDLYKFRTMVVDAEKLQARIEHLNEMDGPVFKISNDPRITSIGRLLRNTSMDELPQLFNVLKGDMSLVGPRPLPERDYDGFDKDWQRKRFSVLPGITCIWQISGRNDVAFDEWMRMDIEYIDNCTLLYDFAILLKTIPAVIGRKGAS